jgi:hypothetical protein
MMISEAKRSQGNGAADGRIAAAQFFDHQDVFQRAQSLAGIFFREMNPEQSQIAGLLPDLAGEFVLLFQFESQILVKFAL